jgi:hypothetical protein
MPACELLSPLPEFGEKIGVFSRACRSALGNAQVIIGCTVLADVLIAGAVPAVVVGGQFGEEGEYYALSIHAEDYDSGFHRRLLSTGKTSVTSGG